MMEMCTDAETILRALEPESDFPALDCYSLAVVWHLCSPSDQSEGNPKPSCLPDFLELCTVYLY